MASPRRKQTEFGQPTFTGPPDVPNTFKAPGYPFVGPPDEPQGAPHDTSPDFAPGTEVHRKAVGYLWDEPGLRVTPSFQGARTGSNQFETQSLASDQARGHGAGRTSRSYSAKSEWQGPPWEDKKKAKGPAAKRPITFKETTTTTQLDPRPNKSKRSFDIPTNGPRVVKVNEWRDRLLQASFRDIPFEVETYSMSVGRRTAVYEYPQRDLPSAQDFGLTTREVSFSAYVLGDDYDLQRNNLIQALEFPGSGMLVHPYYGRFKVNVTSAKVSETSTEYRMAKFDLSFIAVDAVTTSPIVAVNTVMEVDAARTTAVASTQQRLTNAVALVVSPFDTAYSQYKSDATDAINTFFAAQATATGMVFSALGDIDDVQTSLSEFLAPITSIQLLLKYIEDGGPFVDLFADPKQAAAITAFQEHVWCDVLAQCADLVLASDWDSYEELHRTTGEVANAIHTLESDTDDPEVYESMAALRITLMQLVWDLGRVLPRERTVEFVGFVPAIVLSYALYETPFRDEEIVQRNTVVHPTFVVAPAQVLSA